jgi:hypothetical protein
LALVLVLTAVAACGADEAKAATIRTLAVGSWACAPDADGTAYLSFTVQVEGDGTFGVSVDPGAAGAGGAPPEEISGTWAIEDGDLQWAFDDVQGREKSRVEGFDALTPESTRFTLLWAGIFEANDGADDPPDEQEVLVEARGTDSVTFRVPGGEPWTCDRQ